VKLCNDLADIIIVNEEYHPKNAERARSEYVQRKLYNRYVTLIERLSRAEPIVEHRPSVAEAMMTTAYCESKRSSCLKRRVGAVIARANGEILAVGHNDVPDGIERCISSGSGRCARDVIQEKFAANLRHCPRCGCEVDRRRLKCSHCGEALDDFSKLCRKCGKDPEITYTCKCGAQVFKDFVPGTASGTGKLLDMCLSLHAEDNAIMSLGMTGVVSPEDTVLYTTTFPCNLCAKKIIRARIGRVVYAEPYAMEESKRVLEENRVKVDRFEGVKSEAYFRLFR